MARRYFNSRKRRGNFIGRELGFLGVVLFVVVLVGGERYVGRMAGIFQEYGGAGLALILIGGGALGVLSIWKKRHRQAAAERRFRALKLVDLHSIHPAKFEEYVAKLLDHRGYKTKVVGQAGDMGVDVVASKGAEKYAVQVKRYSNPVSRTAVSDAVAGKAYHGCNAAMVVTNNYFTKGARALAQSTNCQLVDRDTLAKWIAELG